MQNFTRNLLTEWRKLNLPFSEKNIVIAVSGGADSTALATALSDLSQRNKLNHKFIIAHYNHNLREKESENDSDFVRYFAKNLGFEFITQTAKKGEINSDENIEQSARKARYKFLINVGKKTDAYAVLTAHTKTDQAETFLMNLLRGSGIEGLTSMKVIRKLNSQNEILLVRPLLNWAKREDVINFTEICNISYCNDSMNEDLNFQRVWLRKKLIPILKKNNPNIVETLANTTNLLSWDLKLISELLSNDKEFETLIYSDSLKIRKLKSLSTPMLYRVLRGWLLIKRGDLRNLDLKHFNAINNLIFSQKSGKIVELPNFEKVIKQDGELIFQVIEVEK